MSSTKHISGISALAHSALSSAPRRPSIYSASQDYLTGLRGVLVIQSFFWLFFQTFIPALVSSKASESQPTYQTILRKAISPLLWDYSLIFTFFIILSARIVGIHFLQDGSTAKFARSLIARPIRVGVPISIALAIAIAIFSTIDTGYISEAATIMKSNILEAPGTPGDAVTGFNSIFDLLWVYSDFSTQAGNTFWPSQTLWVPSVIYYQSYTVYAFMVILPFTRPGWHLQGLILFGLGSFWFNTWGWYSAGGLLVADVSLNPALRSALMRGMKVPKGGDFRLPYWTMALLLLLVGTAMKYLWIAAFPRYFNVEINYHPALYLQPAGGLGNLDKDLPYPRLDNFLVVMGTLFALELSQTAQRWISIKPLTVLGGRSMSKFSSSFHISIEALTDS